MIPRWRPTQLSDETLRGRVIVVGATNRADLIDPALLRPGRFDLIIPVLLPEPEARRDILLAQARAQGGVTIAPEALAALTARTDQYSAADLAFLVRKARKLAERAGEDMVTLAIAEQALRDYRTKTPEKAQEYSRIAIAACNDLEHLPARYRALLDTPEPPLVAHAGGDIEPGRRRRREL